MYIYVYTYTYMYIYSFMCATDCGKHIYFSCCRAGFQVLRDFSTPDCSVACLCLTRVGFLAHACAYIYIGRIYMCMCIYYKYIHTESTCVWIDAARRVHMWGYVFKYMHPRFICVCVYITYIHTKFTCACVYNCKYTHGVYICMCIF